MTIKDLDPDTVLAAARKLATDHPDAVYTPPMDEFGEPGTCSYTRGEAAGQKGCLFGQALRGLGVDGRMLAYSGQRISVLLGKRNNPDLDLAQALQDDGHPWGSCFPETVAEVEALLVGTKRYTRLREMLCSKLRQLGEEDLAVEWEHRA